MRDAPIPVIDPRAIVRRVIRLSFNGVFVAYLGSDDSDRSHPKGPMVAADFAFGTPAQTGSAPHQLQAPYVTVWEDAYEWYRAEQIPKIVHGAHWWVYSDHFSHYRMEFQISADGTKRQIVSIGRALAAAVHAESVRPAPTLRLYVKAPLGSLQSGQPATFLVLNNARIAQEPAAFDLLLQGGWQQPKIQAAYSGQACGGDNTPGLTQRGASDWELQFGDCDEIELTVTPASSGFHRLRIRTYRLAVKPDGKIDQSHRSVVPSGGYEWDGQVH